MSSGSDHSGEYTSDEMNTIIDPESSHHGCCFFVPRSWAVRQWKRVREWSEVVAGPRWKTFIRKFGRRGNAGGQGRFVYDALSYNLNFDDGQNGQFDENSGSRDFSTRFAAFPAMEFGRDGT